MSRHHSPLLPLSLTHPSFLPSLLCSSLIVHLLTPRQPDVVPALIVDFGYLISKHKLEEGDKFEDHLNKNSRIESSAIVDPCLRTVSKGSLIQLERIGFFRVDEAYSAANNRPVVLFKIPDGKAKCCDKK